MATMGAFDSVVSVDPKIQFSNKILTARMAMKFCPLYALAVYKWVAHVFSQ